MEPSHRQSPPRHICTGDFIGFVYEFASASSFFTYHASTKLFPSPNGCICKMWLWEPTAIGAQFATM